MTKYELIDHLIGIREYSEDHAKNWDGDDDDENIWQKDVEVITESIALIQKYVP